jgi:hypothetical protein
MSTPEVTVPGVPVGEAGLSILRVDEEAERTRRSGERTAVLGRYLLLGLGAIALGCGAALVLVHYKLAAFVLLAFGLFLMVLGAVQYLLYMRSRAHWPKEMLLFDDGLELVLYNGEIRAVAWTDPKLEFELHQRPGRAGKGDEALLVWGSDSRVPPCSLTSDGFERLRAEAIRRQLDFHETRRGHGAREVRVYAIKAAPPPKAAPSPSEWGP